MRELTYIMDPLYNKHYNPRNGTMLLTNTMVYYIYLNCAIP